MGSRTKSLLAELRRGLEQLYGPRLKGVYLYGSYARDEADPESDLDILVVLEDYRNYGEEIQRTSELGSNISLKYTRYAKVMITRRLQMTRLRAT